MEFTKEEKYYMDSVQMQRKRISESTVSYEICYLIPIVLLFGIGFYQSDSVLMLISMLLISGIKIREMILSRKYIVLLAGIFDKNEKSKGEGSTSQER